MKRVTFAMKQLGLDPAVYTYVSFCFSLLLNSTTLTEASDNFNRICTVLLTPTLTHDVVEAKKHIQAALANRDKEDDEDRGDERGIDGPSEDDEDDETPSMQDKDDISNCGVYVILFLTRLVNMNLSLIFDNSLAGLQIVREKITIELKSAIC